MNAIFAFALIFILHANDAVACAVCFGDPNSLLTRGIGFGVWTLMGFIFAVLILFASFFWNVRNRMKKVSASH